MVNFPYMTVREVAAEAKLHRMTVNNHIHRGFLRAIKKGANYYISLEDFRAYMAGQGGIAADKRSGARYSQALPDTVTTANDTTANGTARNDDTDTVNGGENDSSRTDDGPSTE